MKIGMNGKIVGGVVVITVLLCAIAGAGLKKVVDDARDADALLDDSIQAAVRLSAAQNAMWQLRWNVAQFIVVQGDERAKLVAGEPKTYQIITDNLGVYEKGRRTIEEREALKDLRDVYAKYVQSRPKWFELLGAGKSEEAAAWRAQTLTQFGGGAVKALEKQISLQQKLVQERIGSAAAENQRALTFITGLLACAAAIAIVLGFLLARGLTRPLLAAINVANRLAGGDLTVKVESTAKDETGQLLAAMQNMVTRLKQVIDGQRAVVAAANRGDFKARIDLVGLEGFHKDIGEGLNQLVATTGASIDDVARVMGAVSEGDLTRGIVKQYEGAFGELKEYTNSTLAKLAQIISEVRGSADSLSGASEQVRTAAQSLSQASSEQAAGVEETSASIEQMTASISQNTENAKVTDGMAAKAAKEGAEGGEAVKSTVAAQEIGTVATSSVELAEKAGALLDAMVPNIRKTSELVQEITAASEEQSSGVNQINTAVSQLSQTTQQNAASSEELAATAEQMSGQAEELQQVMAFFKVGDTDVGRVLSFAAKKPVATKPTARKPNAARIAGNLTLAPSAEPDEAQFSKF